ncbi:hypothetical protein CBR_g38368 [Chara braunii]|uniref:CCHC-type domain-containing protein n=1 Tax=Chara braunii TaxID=69332 RepID=A0A388JNE0_CHABU|nr:hypothetical protein CBR_g38368 [Chara braunii]|eukprot:GBG59339.1 hypothetical protein CBR_g38368 [Chara braunii]
MSLATLVPMEGGGDNRRAKLTMIEKMVATATVMTVLFCCQQERSLGRIRAQIHVQMRKTLHQVPVEGLDTVTSTEVVVQVWCSSMSDLEVVDEKEDGGGRGRILGNATTRQRQCDNKTEAMRRRDGGVEDAHVEKEDHDKQNRNYEQQRQPSIEVGYQQHVRQGRNSTTTIEVRQTATMKGANGDERRLRRESRERTTTRRARVAEDSVRSRITASTGTTMATSSTMAEASSQTTSPGVSQSGSRVSISQSVGLQVSQQTQLTPEDYEILQAEELQDELQRQLDEAAERRRRAIMRKARLGSRLQELSRLEALDESTLDSAMRALRNSLLCVAETQVVQQEVLDELVAGQKRVLAALQAPHPVMRQPQFVVAPPSGTGPSVTLPPVGLSFSPMFGMPPPGGYVATSGPVHRVSAVPSTTVVTTVPLSSQAQVSVQQPVSVAMQPLQQSPGPMQPMQWMPKIPLLSPKPFSGDRKKDEDLDTWVRTVPTYVRHKLTRPHQEVVVAASFLEGSTARWLNGLVQQQGYGQNFDAWAQAQTLEEFVRSMYNRWHDLQGAQKATGAINSLCARRYINVRELTGTVERLLVVPGVRYDQQVLLTDYLRCLPSEVRTNLVDEAYVEQHNFASFSKKTLDIEAKLESAHQSQGDGRKKRLPQDWKKKGRLMFVDHDGQTTEIDEFPDLGEETKHDGASEASDGGVVAPIKEKARGTRKKKVGRSTGQGDQGTPTWVKLGLEYEVWRDRVARGTCMNCGNYGHTSRSCRGKKVLTRVASPTVVRLSSNPDGVSTALRRETPQASRTGHGSTPRRMLTRSQTAGMEQKPGESDEAYETRMMAMMAESKQQVEAAAAARKKKAEAERLRLLAEEQRQKHAAAAAKAADEERVRRRELLFKEENAVHTQAKDWQKEAESGESDDYVNKLSQLLNRVSDLLATCIAQQEDTHSLDHTNQALQQSVDRQTKRVHQLEQRPVATSSVGPSDLADRVKVLKIDVETLKTGEQRLEQQVCAATVGPSMSSPESIPKFDGLPIFCAYTLLAPVRAQVGHPQGRRQQSTRILVLTVRRCVSSMADNMLSVHVCTIFEFYNFITWTNLTAAWQKRFQVEPPEHQAMDKLLTFSHNIIPSGDWISEFQHLVSTPKLPMTFDDIKLYFINRSCLALQNALTQVAESLNTSEELFNKAAQIIVTNMEAKNIGRSSTVGQGAYQHRPKVAVVAAAMPSNPSTSNDTASSDEGDRLAAARNGGRPAKGRGRGKTKTNTISSRPGQAAPAQEPWTHCGLTEPGYRVCSGPLVGL